MDVATGEPVDGPIDRARYSPVAWLPGGEAFYYVRRLAAGRSCPTARSSTTAGSGCTGSGTDPDDDVAVFGDGLDKTNYYGVTVVDGRPLAGRSAPRPAPRRATTCGSPTCPTAALEAPDAAGRAGGRRRQHRRCTSAGTAGSTSSPTATRRAAGSR